MSFKVLLHSSINKALVGDVFEINTAIVIVTLVSNRKVYLDGIPYNRKKIDKMKREYIKSYYDGKSWALN